MLDVGYLYTSATVKMASSRGTGRGRYVFFLRDMPKLLNPLTCHDASCVLQPHIIVVNSVIITLWLEISGAVLKGETIQSSRNQTEESASALCQWGEDCSGIGGFEVAVLLLMLFGFESRQEFCFIRAWGPIRAVHPL